MKKKNVEMILQKIPSHPSPKPSLEQYTLSADIAADILIHFYNFGMIQDKVIADLGCGTGRLSIGASLLGAKKVYAVDVDEVVLKVLEDIFHEFRIQNIQTVNCDVSEFDIKVDSVIQNPPFGSQKRHADRKFLLKASQISKNIATLHNAETEEFVLRFMERHGFKAIWRKKYMMSIPHMFSFHKKNLEKIHVCGIIFSYYE